MGRPAARFCRELHRLVLKYLQQAADGTLPRVTIYDLRHTAASLAISAGANVKAVQRMLGNASAEMALDTYADLFDDDLDAVSEALDHARAKRVVGEMWGFDPSGGSNPRLAAPSEEGLGAEGGTRTHTPKHRNLNPACLPIPPLPRAAPSLPTGPAPSGWRSPRDGGYFSSPTSS